MMQSEKEKIVGELSYLKNLTRNEFVTKVYELYGRKLYAYSIRSWNLNEDSAWDLIYKTLFRVAEVYHTYTFETETKFASFIFRIFINYLRNHYRDTKGLAGMEPVSIDGHDIPVSENPEQATTNAKLAALNEELEKMEDWQRLLLLMRSEGRPYSEIAQYIDKPEKQLKVYYQRLKKQISKKLHERIK